MAFQFDEDKVEDHRSGKRVIDGSAREKPEISPSSWPESKIHQTLDKDVFRLFFDGQHILVLFQEGSREERRSFVPDIRQIVPQLTQQAHLCHQENRLESAYGLYSLLLEFAVTIGNQEFKGRILNALGQVCRELKRLDEALKYYLRAFEVAKALRFNQGGVVVLGNIGSIYRELGKPEDARRAYEQALKLDPDNEELRNALEQLKD